MLHGSALAWFPQGWASSIMSELLLEEQNRLPAIWTVKHSNPPGNKGQCCTFGHYWIIWDDLWWGWEENRRLWERCKWLDLRPISISICLIDMWIKSLPPSGLLCCFQTHRTSQEPVKQYVNKEGKQPSKPQTDTYSGFRASAQVGKAIFQSASSTAKEKF